MSLGPGTRLGPYEIVSAIGAGAMGEVYRARDTRLQRDVAIKVLPAAFLSDPDRLARFEQEARAAAALNHPNILAVHDIGTQESAPYIVSELLEGETLRDRLGHGALPVRKAIEYAVQIAHGLEAAHEKGIVHRDLKPENVFVTSDGRVKILDFGLAKLTQTEPTLAGISVLPTGAPDTLAGVVLGTLGYMAPEQVRGQSADHRADIFAFGAILYEMLAGLRAFRGDTAADTMTAILKEDPADLPMVERHIPTALGRIVDRCLEKNPAARFKSADDLGFSLEALSTHSETRTTPGSPASIVGSSRFHASLPWVVALVFLGTTLLLASLQFFRSPPAQPLVRFQVSPPTGGMFPGANFAPRMSISPDGQYLAFTINLRDGKPDQLWIRKLDSLEARALSNTEAPLNAAEPAQSPFWSPDSRYVAFFADGKLRKVDMTSGGVQTLSSMPGNNYGGTWNRDGTILYGTSRTKGLQRVSADGGVPSQVTTLDTSRKETAHLWPQFLPDGRHFLYLALGESVDGRGVYVGSIESNERKLVLKSEYRAHFAPPGYLFFVRDGALMVQPFDVTALELQGEPTQMAEGIQGSLNNGRIAFAASETGTLAYRPGAGTLGADSQLVWFDRTGKELGTLGPPSSYRGVELSPDGLHAAVHREERAGSGDLWVLDLERGSTARFTFDATQHNVSPIWSLDGRRIFFSRNSGTAGAGWPLYERDSTGVGGEKLVYDPKNQPGFDWDTPLSVTPDGQSLVFGARNVTTLGDLLVLSLSGEREASPYLQVPFNQLLGQLSPDGRWIAYSSNESGRNEIYVQGFPSPGTRYQVSADGGTQPRWRRDGKELFYLTVLLTNVSGTAGMMSVDVEAAGAGLRFGIPERLFDSYALGFGEAHPPAFSYSVTSDGKRFLVARQLAAENSNPEETPLTVVLNWTSLLARR
jgi:eukaryotic-like serine/threonine-protein kinase